MFLTLHNFIVEIIIESGEKKIIIQYFIIS